MSLTYVINVNSTEKKYNFTVYLQTVSITFFIFIILNNICYLLIYIHIHLALN